MKTLLNGRRCVVILVAAGKGVRAGGPIPKQYQPIIGKPLIRLTLEHIVESAPGIEILPVIAEGADDLFAYAADGITTLDPTYGGSSRQESVKNGLKKLASNPPDFVLVHDAARPFLSSRIVADLIGALDDGWDGALPALPVADTLKKSSDGIAVDSTASRDGLYRAQTPQAFRYKTLLTAHMEYSDEATDDIQLIERAAGRCAIVSGDDKLFKVTRQEDFIRVIEQLLLERPDIRTATGFDVHKFGDGDHITLGGIKIPHSRGLVGHSDADVVLHALTDALMGTIAAGDIGDHFPPSDDTWAGAPSDIFLNKAVQLVADKDGLISNLSVVIMAERPKIGPHKDAMRDSIAAIAGISADRVSVQATTTEKLGFTGREEGLAVTATATVRLPMAG